MGRARQEVAPQKHPIEMTDVRPPAISTGREIGGMTLAVVFLGLAAFIFGVVISVGGHISCAAVGFAGCSIARTRAKTEIPRSPFPDGDLALPPASERSGNVGQLHRTGPATSGFTSSARVAGNDWCRLWTSHADPEVAGLV